MTTHQIASEAIGLFLESLGHLDINHGLDSDEIERATAMALNEVMEGTREEAVTELPHDFLGNIGPWDDDLLNGDMEACVERLRDIRPLDAVRLVLWSRRHDSHTNVNERLAIVQCLHLKLDNAKSDVASLQKEYDAALALLTRHRTGNPVMVGRRS